MAAYIIIFVPYQRISVLKLIFLVSHIFVKHMSGNPDVRETDGKEINKNIKKFPLWKITYININAIRYKICNR